MAAARKSNPNSEADNLLERFHIRTVPVPVDKIGKNLGAAIRYSPLDEELSGMIYIKDDNPIIGVNALHHPHRQRFTIAHEIGHLVMHRHLLTGQVHVDKKFSIELRVLKRDPQELRVLKRDGQSALGMDQFEIEANQFAAALLIPTFFLENVLNDKHHDIDDEAPIEQLAKSLRVSKQTLEYRIRNFH